MTVVHCGLDKGEVAQTMTEMNSQIVSLRQQLHVERSKVNTLHCDAKERASVVAKHEHTIKRLQGLVDTSVTREAFDKEVERALMEKKPARIERRSMERAKR